MAGERTIVVKGATGKRGGAVIHSRARFISRRTSSSAPVFFMENLSSRREIDLAGDAVTMPQAAALGLQEPIEVLQVPMSEVRKNSEDFA